MVSIGELLVNNELEH